MPLPQRKHPRLKTYDYSRNGCYFVTICAKDRQPVFGAVGRDAHIPPEIILSNAGRITEEYIRSIPSAYDGITVDKYVIMPNHIHLLIRIEGSGGMRASRPTLHTVIRTLKTLVTKRIGFGIWQASYYDSVIRSEAGYLEAWQYIDENPQKWKEDELNVP